MSNARLAYTNLAQAAATVVTVSSEQAGSPRSWLQDEDRGLKWRSKVGWNIVAGVNDKIDFNRGGVKAATLTAGNYATAALMAAQIVTALEAADSTPVWACSYNSGTGIFTISSDLAFTLLFATGTNLTTSVHLDLGYTSTDKGSATSQVAEGASYKSREWVVVDFGSAMAVQAGIVIEHNLGSSGTITQQGHTANTAAGWAAPDVTDTLTGDGTIRLVNRASASKRYWRLLVNDVSTNTAGYTEIGIWYVGPYSEPSVNYSVEFTKQRVPLSTLTASISGATKRDARSDRIVYTMSWLEIPAADRTILAAWAAACPLGKPAFLLFDYSNTPTNTVYGYLADGVPEQMSGNLYFTVPLTFAETLP